MSINRVVDSRTLSGIVVELKFTDNSVAEAAGRSWYAVIGGNVKFPAKKDGVTDEASARAWLNSVLRKRGLLTR